jgi:hypothetical protein
MYDFVDAASADAVILGLVPSICRGCRLSPRQSAFRSTGVAVIASIKADPRDKPEDDGNAHTPIFRVPMVICVRNTCRNGRGAYPKRMTGF